jgi:hypothetical protein
MAEKARHIGPDSRPYMLAKLDQRTREAALLRRVRADLTEHCGGQPSAVQRMLIERLAKVALRLDLYDRKFRRVSRSPIMIRGLSRHCIRLIG